MSRIPELNKDELTDEQLEIYNAILGSRGNIAGPFRIWMYSPEFADRAQRLGEFVRYKTLFELRLSELAILVTARFWDCQVEWSLHEPFAVEGGLGADVIDAVRAGRVPDFQKPDEQAVYDFVTELLNNGSVADRTFNTLLDHAGNQGAVELTGLVGYYAMAAMTLNTFQVPLPEGVPALLSDCPTFR